jgi:hypothetical protein
MYTKFDIYILTTSEKDYQILKTAVRSVFLKKQQQENQQKQTPLIWTIWDNNFKLIGSNKTKGPKQDNQNQLRSPMSEGGEP